MKTNEELPEEIAALVAILNNYQAQVYRGQRMTREEVAHWHDTIRRIRNRRYVVKKKTLKNGLGYKIGVNWFAVPFQEVAQRNRHFCAEWKDIDMRPQDGTSTRKGDCTTRAMAYCLQGAMSYREIEAEQYRVAERKNRERGLHWGDCRSKYHRNTNGIWDLVILARGYSWLRFKSTIRRDRLATMLRSFSRPIISHSASHVAVLDSGAVIDTWDSRHGRCDSILVCDAECDEVTRVLEENGVTMR